MITEGNTREIYDITGLTPLAGGYEFTFPYSSSQDVRVYTTGNKIDTEVPSSNYTIDKSGATPKVVFNAGYSFPAGQTRLTIIRNVSYSQELDLRNGDLIDADKLEGALDDITQQIQQVAEKVDRAILASVSDTVPLSIPESTERSNMLLGFDNDGKVIPVLTTDIEQKLAQALAAEESAITAKNAAETAQHEAEAAKAAAETSQFFAETAQERAEAAEASCQALLGSVATKTEESIASINTAKTGAVGAVSTQQATSIAAVQAAQNTAESDIAGKRASALTAIDSAKTSAVAAVNTQKEASVAAADREIVAKRDSALSDIQTARTNASNAITSQKDSSLQEIEQLASERKAEINSLAANQKADVKTYTDAVVAAAKTEIDTEKTTAVTAVQEEGTTQVAAVQAIYAEDYARVTAENNALKVEVARNRRQIENLNDRLDGDLIENKFKMTGETPDAPGVLSLPPSKLLPNAEVDEIHGKTEAYSDVDLGTLTWVYDTGSRRFYTQSISDIRYVGANSTEGISCDRYTPSLGGGDKTIFKGTNSVIIYDSAYTSASAFKTAMNGVVMKYDGTNNTLHSSRNVQVKSVGKNLWTHGIGRYSISPEGEVSTSTTAPNYVGGDSTTKLPLYGAKKIYIEASGLNGTEKLYTAFYTASGTVIGARTQQMAREVEVPNGAEKFYMYFYCETPVDDISHVTIGVYAHSSQIVELPQIELKGGDTYYPATGKVQPTMKEVQFPTDGWIRNVYSSSVVYARVFDDISPSTMNIMSTVSSRVVDWSRLGEIGNTNDFDVSVSPTKMIGFAFLKTSVYAEASKFYEAIAGKEVLYELATPPEPTNVPPIDNGLAIESNGTITVECEGAQAEALVHYAIDNRS